MRSTGSLPNWASVEVAVPDPSRRLPGISMAGFRQRTPAPVDIAMVAHPSVTLLVDLTEEAGLACDAGDRHERGSVVIGLAPGDLRVTGGGPAFAGLTPTAVAVAPWLAIDDVAWPA